MGFDLTNDAGEEFQFNNAGWRCVVEFAEIAGFAWPVAKGGEELDRLTPDQARALSDAIEGGIGNRTDAEAAGFASKIITERLVLPWKSRLFRNDPIVITERGIGYWREFVRFCRSGGFSMNY